jgi:hypothetical protein
MPPENEKYIIGSILMSACMKFMGKMFRYGIPAHTGPFRELPVNIIPSCLSILICHLPAGGGSSET